MRTGTGNSIVKSAGLAPDHPDRLPPDFYRLWTAFTANQMGSAIGTGALPLVAILVVAASDLQISLMAALAGIAAAAIALPMGSFLEFRRKRGAMVSANLLACLALATVPIAAWLGVLTYAHLCVVAAAQTLSGLVFNAAKGAHLKTLVSETHLVRAHSRLETTFWTATTLGGPVGGVLISVLGTTTTLIIDAGGHLASALGLRRLRTPEPRSAPRPAKALGQWISGPDGPTSSQTPRCTGCSGTPCSSAARSSSPHR